MKEAERDKLLNEIISFCRKNYIKGSFNNPCGKYRVSFDIEPIEDYVNATDSVTEDKDGIN